MEIHILVAITLAVTCFNVAFSTYHVWSVGKELKELKASWSDLLSTSREFLRLAREKGL